MTALHVVAGLLLAVIGARESLRAAAAGRTAALGWIVVMAIGFVAGVTR